MTSNWKTALVTGANRGIGLAIATGLAARGDIKVLLGSRDYESGVTATGTIPYSTVTPVHLALENKATLNQQLETILADHGPIDILVNNAGVLTPGNVLDASESGFSESMRINFEAPLELIRRLVPDMIQRGYGRIVNVSSGWGSFGEGLSGPAAYSISKAAMNALTLSLSQSVPKTVKVNAMCPGWVRTRMGGQAADRSPEQGADTAIWLATLPDNGPSGGFFRDRKPIEW